MKMFMTCILVLIVLACNFQINASESMMKRSVKSHFGTGTKTAPAEPAVFEEAKKENNLLMTYNWKDILPEPALPFSPRSYVSYRTDEKITIDGKPDEKIWSKADWTEDFVDIEGHLKPAPLFRTRAKILWDDDYLYFAAELEEPHIWANLTERESIIFYDNDFEVFIDPDGDTHNYYEFEMNAFGTEWDLMLIKPYRDGGPPVFGWNINKMKVGVHIDGTINDPSREDKKWTLEIAMPWTILKECAPEGRRPKAGEQWRLGFSRVEWQVEVVDGKYVKKINPETGKHYPEYNWVWSPQGLINMHYPELWGFLQFSGKVAGTGTDKFVFNPEEHVKWALRRVYYKQRNYQAKHGKFTSDYSKLGLDDISIEGYEWKPEIQCTQSMFEATARSYDGGFNWHIRDDGLIWRD